MVYNKLLDAIRLNINEEPKNYLVKIKNLIWLFCMKVVGEAFFMKKGAEGAIYKMYLNSQAKGLLPDRTLESFYYLKTPKVQFLNVRKFLLGRKTELDDSLI